MNGYVKYFNSSCCSFSDALTQKLSPSRTFRYRVCSQLWWYKFILHSLRSKGLSSDLEPFSMFKKKSEQYSSQSVHHHLPAACFEDGVNSLIQCPQLSNWTWCFLLQGIIKCIQLWFDCFRNNMSETRPHLCWADFVTFAFQDFGCTQSFASNCVVGYTRTQWLIKASISPLFMAGVNFFPVREQAITEANLQLLSLCLQKLSPDAKNLANYYSLFHRFLWSLSFFTPEYGTDNVWKQVLCC